MKILNLYVFHAEYCALSYVNIELIKSFFYNNSTVI